VPIFWLAKTSNKPINLITRLAVHPTLLPCKTHALRHNVVDASLQKSYVNLGAKFSWLHSAFLPRKKERKKNYASSKKLLTSIKEKGPT